MSGINNNNNNINQIPLNTKRLSTDGGNPLNKISTRTSSITSDSSATSQYTDALQDLSSISNPPVQEQSLQHQKKKSNTLTNSHDIYPYETIEDDELGDARDFVMAKRIKDSEVIDNKVILNPLKAPFAYLDGSVSFGDELKIVATGLKNVIHTHGEFVEDTGLKESEDKERMQRIEEKIHTLQQIESNNDISERHSLVDSLGNIIKPSNDKELNNQRLIQQIKHDMELEKENKALTKIKFDSEPITLPNRNKIWQHSNNEQYLENYKLRSNLSDTVSLSDDNLSFRKLNIQNAPEDSKLVNKNQSSTIQDPQTVLDKKNDKKTSHLVDAFLLGYADTVCLESSFLKDETGMKKGSLLIPLLSVCLTDITNDMFLSKKIVIGQDNSIKLSNLDNSTLLQLACFSRNRIFRLHIEYGVGDHVLRWDMEKDTKSLLAFHRKLVRKTKDRIDKAYKSKHRHRDKDKEITIPEFPKLPTNNLEKLKSLIKGVDRDILSLTDAAKQNHHNPQKSIFLAPNSITSNNQLDNNGENNNANNETNGHEDYNEAANSNKTENENSLTAKNDNDQHLDDTASVVPPALERGASSDSVISLPESTRSLTHTLTRLSTVAFANLRYKSRAKEKERERVKERQKEQEKEGMQAMREKHVINQVYIKQVQAYFDFIISNVSLKDQSNKILQFFELSPFSLLLSNEIYRKRKEGYLFIVSSASKQGWRVGHFRLHDLTEMIKRHTSKWCIMGDSFLMYTSDITSTTPEEVFLIDSKTTMIVSGFSKSNTTSTPNEMGDGTDSYYNYNLNDNDNAHGDGKNDSNGNSNSKDDDKDDDKDESEDPYYITSKSILKGAKSYPTIKLTNSERSISLVAKNPKVTREWASGFKKIIEESEWSKPHRFNSFAPVRHNAFAQWFVDARDYWYAASSAIEMAKDVIYIHDWWLSPELYLRRPANGNQNYRIDRLLEKKAKEGVKIFVIIYRNVGNTVVTDSMYTKHSLLDLHENIYVLRSPNQIMQNVFFWAHHEKLLIIDHSVCFLGGIDLCFGRYDTPDHVLVDDSKFAFNVEKNNINQSSANNSSSTSNTKNNTTVRTNNTRHSQSPYPVITNDSNADHYDSTNILDANNSLPYDFQEQFQIFPGKDYSNPRKKDFFELPSPHNDMYNRQAVPRMPWHDVHMVTGGQVARDLSRHFIQRWNYLLRQKRPSRPTPLLIPPRPFTDEELTNLNLRGNCEIQLLRSSGDWSLGLKEHEQSIMNAYIKCIEQSEHFVYMENQFFVTSCTIESCVVKNQIGDALVDRIITAHKNGEVWKAVIVIPLMPGFEADVDTKEGGSVRLIMQCQYMSISMGETSIFARLRRVGIKPEDYITFYSLRKWGLISEKKLLVTEQLYIHAKTMIVDDRIAIIGSANVNERSMRGTRDSEVCAIVRDKDMIESKMDGKTYHVGKFSHSLRVRLMREHLGVDVDLLDLVERRFNEIENFCNTKEGIHASVLKSSQGKQVLSAMVEMGTRYLLGLYRGTPGFCEKNKNNLDYGEKLTKEMISTFTNIKTEADKSDSLDEIEFSFSFNHRAGNENVGIRSDKNFSSDTRVTTESHRNEVKGEIDGFNSKYYKEAKIQFNKFLAQKVNQCSHDLNIDEDFMKQKNYPLPDFEDIVDVLSQNVIEDASASEQNAINTDRWTMIKRLYYMKKLYCKMANKVVNENLSAGSNTRGSAGVGDSEVFKDFDSGYIRSRSATNGDRSVIKISESGTNHGSPEFSTTRSNQHSTNNTMTNEGHSNNGNGSKKIRIPDIPLVKLKNEDIHDIDKNMLPQVDFEFLDPYGFEDPLDIGFYEGTWMTQAIRNTLLFQMVFHVQPDDSVQTWKDYKDFEDLKNAFDVYQKIYKNEINMESNENNKMNNNNNGDDIIQGISGDIFDEDVVEHRRRVERNFKLAELERFQKISGSVGTVLPGASGFVRGAVYDYHTSLKLMGMVRGHVVMFPTRWLKKEVESSNWFYKADKIPPIQIYN